LNLKTELKNQKMATSPKTWQLSWNNKNYDYEGRMRAAAANIADRYMMQSWGRTSTKNISKVSIGDILYISCKKKCIMKAVVTQEFHELANIPKDRFVKIQTETDERLNANKYFCQIKIEEIYFNEYQQDLVGNQNTICDPTNAFWKK
tara:strand:- start:187 stop:630 length:444 start_codon:yes stop_codon:yes gene_type:complete